MSALGRPLLEEREKWCNLCYGRSSKTSQRYTSLLKWPIRQNRCTHSSPCFI